MTIYYLTNNRLSQELKERDCIEALTKFQYKNFTSLKIHKLKGFGDNIYTMYVNKADRIIFSRQDDSITVLDVVRFHKYHKVRLQDTSPRAEWVHEAQEVEPKGNFEAAISDTEEIFYDGNVVTLSPVQQLGKTARLPLLISGAPGSGKTLVAREILLEYVIRHSVQIDGDSAAEASPAALRHAAAEEVELSHAATDTEDKVKQKVAYYIAPNEQLRTKMKSTIEELPGMARYLEEGRIKIMSYEDFYKEKFLNGKETEFANFDTFEAWYNKQKIQNIIITEFGQKKGNSETLGKRNITELYRELSIAAAAGSEEVYTNLGKDQSSVPMDLRVAIYTLFNSYKQFLTDAKALDLTLSIAAAKPGDLIILDEAQTYTHCQLKTIRDSFGDRAVYLGDSDQSMMSTVSYSVYIKGLYPKDELRKLNILTWGYSHRCPAIIQELAAKFVGARNSIFGTSHSGNAAKDSGSVEEEKQGGSYVLNSSEREVILEVNSADVAYIVATTEAKRILNEKGITNIFLPEEILGLEFPHVVLYGMFSSVLACGLVNRDGDAYKKEAELTPEHSLYLNKMFVAVTRTTRNIYVVEDFPEVSKKRTEFLMGKIDLFEDDKKSRGVVPLDIKKIDNSTPAQWFNKAIELAKHGNNNQVEQILNHLQKELKQENIDVLLKIHLDFIVNNQNLINYEAFQELYNSLSEVRKIVGDDFELKEFFQDVNDILYKTVGALKVKSALAEEEKLFITFLLENGADPFCEIDGTSTFSLLDISTYLGSHILASILSRNALQVFNYYIERNDFDSLIALNKQGHFDIEKLKKILTEEINKPGADKVKLVYCLFNLQNDKEKTEKFEEFLNFHSEIIKGSSSLFMYYILTATNLSQPSKEKMSDLLLSSYLANPSKALYLAVRDNNSELAQTLKDNYQANPSEALYFAVKDGESKLAQTLKDNYQADPSEALYFALINNEPEIAQILQTTHKAVPSKVMYFAVTDDNLALGDFEKLRPLELKGDFLALMEKKLKPGEILSKKSQEKLNAISPLQNLEDQLEALFNKASDENDEKIYFYAQLGVNFKGRVTKWYNSCKGNNAKINAVITRLHKIFNGQQPVTKVYKEVIAELFYLAVKAGNEKVTNVLQKDHKANPAEAFYLAVKAGDNNTAAILMSDPYNANPSEALYFAIKAGDSDLAAILMSDPYNANPSEALYYALKAGDEGKDSLDVLNNYKVDPLKAMYCALRAGKDGEKLVSVLINIYNVSLAEVKYFSLTAGDDGIDIIHALSSYQVNQSEVMYFAVKYDDKETADKLKSAPYKTNSSEALYFAIKAGDNNTADIFISDTYSANPSEAFYYAIKADKDGEAAVKSLKKDHKANSSEAMYFAIKAGKDGEAAVKSLKKDHKTNPSEALYYAIKAGKDGEAAVKDLQKDHEANPSEALYYELKSSNQKVTIPSKFSQKYKSLLCFAVEDDNEDLIGRLSKIQDDYKIDLALNAFMYILVESKISFERKTNIINKLIERFYASNSLLAIYKVLKTEKMDLTKSLFEICKSINIENNSDQSSNQQVIPIPQQKTDLLDYLAKDEQLNNEQKLNILEELQNQIYNLELAKILYYKLKFQSEESKYKDIITQQNDPKILLDCVIYAIQDNSTESKSIISAILKKKSSIIEGDSIIGDELHIGEGSWLVYNTIRLLKSSSSDLEELSKLKDIITYLQNEFHADLSLTRCYFFITPDEGSLKLIDFDQSLSLYYALMHDKDYTRRNARVKEVKDQNLLDNILKFTIEKEVAQLGTIIGYFESQENEQRKLVFEYLSRNAATYTNDEIEKILKSLGMTLTGGWYFALVNNIEIATALKNNPKMNYSEALYYAVMAGEDKFTNAATSLMTDPYNANPSEALYYAIKAGDEKVTNALQNDHNANPSEALYYAIKAGDEGVINALQNDHNANQSEALYYAIKADDDGKVAAALMSHGANLSEALYYAVENDNDNIIKVLRNNPNVKQEETISYAKSKNSKSVEKIQKLFSITSKKPAEKLYDALVADNKDDLKNIKDKNKLSAEVMYFALRDKNFDLAKILQNKYNANPSEALYFALKTGKIEEKAVVDALIKTYDADPSEALYFALKTGKIKEKAVVDALIKTHNADPSEALYFALRDDKSELAKSLKTTHGADSSKALYYAVRDDDTTTATTLTEPPYKADPSKALYWALKAGKDMDEDATALMSHGADPSKALYWAIYFECQKNPEANCTDIIREYTQYNAKLPETKSFAANRGQTKEFQKKIIKVIDNHAANTIQNVTRGYQARILVERSAKDKQYAGCGSIQK
jgi:hypothetical protein